MGQMIEDRDELIVIIIIVNNHISRGINQEIEPLKRELVK